VCVVCMCGRDRPTSPCPDRTTGILPVWPGAGVAASRPLLYAAGRWRGGMRLARNRATCRSTSIVATPLWRPKRRCISTSATSLFVMSPRRTSGTGSAFRTSGMWAQWRCAGVLSIGSNEVLCDFRGFLYRAAPWRQTVAAFCASTTSKDASCALISRNWLDAFGGWRVHWSAVHERCQCASSICGAAGHPPFADGYVRCSRGGRACGCALG